MKEPKICAAIVDNDLEAVKKVAPFVDLFEVRIDLIGDGWRELVGKLEKPWLGCNRRVAEGGAWNGDEASRVEQLIFAAGLGADIIDIELQTENLGKVLSMIKGRAECLLSYHNLQQTPPLNDLKEIVQEQLEAGADICKVVTTAECFADNMAVLQLASGFPHKRVVSFAMGPLGVTSRVLCPFTGAEFTYASVAPGRGSAPGQITVRELRKVYEMVRSFREN